MTTAGRAPLKLVAPVTGVLVPLEEVPDEVFAKRMVGDGISIDPLSQLLVAPCDAIVTQVHRAAHAVTLSAHGVEIVIHIGLDTVVLDGSGFEARVQAGDRVMAGDALIQFDADFVATHARSLLTQMVVASSHSVLPVRGSGERVTAGRDTVLQVALSEDGEGAHANDHPAVRSAPILVANETGLHARPAALVAAAARRFAADIRLIKGDHEANARSVVSIMALEVSSGDRVVVSANGPDAADAIAHMTDVLQRHDEPLPPQQRPVTRDPNRTADEDGVMHGMPSAPGIAVGRIFHFRHDDIVLEERAADSNHERRALDAAIASAHLQLEALQARLAAEADRERAAIFAAHQELLEDPEVLDRAADSIQQGFTAGYAWREAISSQAERLLALRNEMFAGRAADLQDVGRRVLHLLVGKELNYRDIPANSIVIADDLAPSDAATLDRSTIQGFCTIMGSATSHVAILARALGIPAITGIDPRAGSIANGTLAVMDGGTGTLVLEPDAAQLADAKRAQDAAARMRQAEQAHAGEPAVTMDGERIEVVANIGAVSEAAAVLANGGEGVGLLRTEFLFMDRHEAPTEDEQAEAYEAVARALGPDRILIIRTLDVGGDKPLPYMPMSPEPNPFLGERGIRLTLERPDVMRPQVRAVLRAAHTGRIAIMFPMIATFGEWRAARAIVAEECRALGIAAIPTGVMIETAAAALIAPQLAQEADFFSIGTNDLTQYTLAMDRTNPRLATQVDTLHPAILRLIAYAVEGARLHGKWVGVCGALAADPDAIPILIGLGVTELSASVPAIAGVKARVRQLSMSKCRAIAAEALLARDGEQVRTIVARA